MNLGRLFNEWILLKKNSLCSLNFEQYVKAFGSYQEVLTFNIMRDKLISIDNKLSEYDKK